MWEMFIRQWDWRELCVPVKLSYLIGRAWVRIRGVITPIWGRLNPIGQVLPLISHICSYPPCHSHLHPPCLFLLHNSIIMAEHKVISALCICPCYDELTQSTAYNEYSIHQVQHTPRTAYTKYSIHQVQHTPSAAYINYNIDQVQHPVSTASIKYSIHWVQHPPKTVSPKDWLSSLHSQDYILTPECSFIIRLASLTNVCHQWSSSSEHPR